MDTPAVPAPRSAAASRAAADKFCLRVTSVFFPLVVKLLIINGAAFSTRTRALSTQHSAHESVSAHLTVPPARKEHRENQEGAASGLSSSVEEKRNRTAD